LAQTNPSSKPSAHASPPAAVLRAFVLHNSPKELARMSQQSISEQIGSNEILEDTNSPMENQFNEGVDVIERLHQFKDVKMV
jgi:hypothetical protein